MSQHLPPDMDRLLWEIAESQDRSAYDDFETRFPHLVGELGKRIKLVRELRDARADGSTRPMPRFDRRQPSRSITPTPLGVAVATLALASLGLGAYWTTTKFVSPHVVPPKTVPLDPAPKLPVEQPVVSPTAPQYSQPTPNTGNAAPVPTAEPSVASYLRPQSVQFDRIKLQTALIAVGASAGLTIEFAPNMPNPEIRLAYREVNAIDMFKDLGARFGFTAFTEGGNRVLMVPARDPNATEAPLSAGAGFATNLNSEIPTKPAKPTDSGPGVKKTSTASTGP